MDERRRERGGESERERERETERERERERETEKREPLLPMSKRTGGKGPAGKAAGPCEATAMLGPGARDCFRDLDPQIVWPSSAGRSRPTAARRAKSASPPPEKESMKEEEEEEEEEEKRY